MGKIAMISRPLLVTLLTFVLNLRAICSSNVGDPSWVLQPIARYAFTKEQCNEGRFFDSTKSISKKVAPFSRDTNGTKCSKGLGIETLFTSTGDFLGDQSGALLKLTSNSIEDNIILYAQQGAKGISFEFWVEPLATRGGASFPIFTLGWEDSYMHGGGTGLCDRNHFDFQISQVDDRCRISFRGAGEVHAPCYSSLLNVTIPSGKLLHLVVALEDKHQKLYINSHAYTILKERFPDNLQHWNAGSAMHFFSHLASTANHEKVWHGRLYQFSVYNRALSPQEVTHNLAAGLPPGHPYAYPYQVAINEDAEEVPESHTPEWYATPPGLTFIQDAKGLQKMPLRIRTVEDEVDALLASINITRTSTSGMPPVKVPSHNIYITGLPHKGKLYHFTAGSFVELYRQRYSELSSIIDQAFVIHIEDTSSLVFVPAFNDHSEKPGEEYTSIMYCVTDQIIFDPAQCESATISITVNPVNDPPIAYASPMSSDVLEGLESNFVPSIALGGTDVDKGDSTASIQITRLPQWGSLILRVTNFREDGLYHGTNISVETNFTLACDKGNPVHVRYVFYRPNSISPKRPVPGNGASDLFRFRISDEKGAWSSEETVHINIVSALTADSPGTIHQFIHDYSTPTNLNVHDTSGYDRALAIFIESEPPWADAWLTQSERQKRVKAGSIIFLAHNQQNASLSFVRGPRVCKPKQFTETTNFTYRAVAVKDGFVTSASPIAVQHVKIDCLDPFVEISATPNFIQLQTFNISSQLYESCGSTVYESPITSSSTCPFAAALNDIIVKGSSPYPMLVTIIPGNGFISLDKKTWHEIKVVRGRRSLASGNVTFWAPSSQLQTILTGLSFRSQVAGYGRLTIFVRSGACNGFRHEADLDMNVSPKPPSCHTAVLHITAHVTEGEQHDVFKTDPMGFPWQVLVGWLGYPLAYYCLSVFLTIVARIKASIRKCCRRCRGKPAAEEENKISYSDSSDATKKEYPLDATGKGEKGEKGASDPNSCDQNISLSPGAMILRDDSEAVDLEKA